MTTALAQAQAFMREWPVPGEPGSDEFVEWVNDFTAAFDLDRGDQAECDLMHDWCVENNTDIVDYWRNHQGDASVLLSEGVSMADAMTILYASHVLTDVALPGVAVGAWQEITLRIWFDPSGESAPNTWAWEEIIDTELRIVEYKEAEYLDAAGSPVTV